MSTVEEWRLMPRDDRYEVSSHGRVRRIDTGKILRARMEGRYLRVQIRAPGMKKQHGKMHYVHRLVCEAFHGAPPPDKPLACHDDDDGLNNHKDNLCWGDNSDNRKDALRNGARTALRGREHPKAHPDSVVNEARRLLFAGLSTRAVAAKMGVGKSFAHRLQSGYHHAGD